MNRKILFRGKRIDDGEWEYGYYADLPIESPYATYLFGDEEKICEDTAPYIIVTCAKQHSNWSSANPLEVVECEQYEVDPETVGEYTGLTDKNGTKVFEGDIVEFDVQSGKTRDVVIWSDGEYNGVAGFRLKSRALYSITSYNRQYFEVVGNVWDNADLLEDKNG